MKITEQITVKLNAKRFRPLMKELESFAGDGLIECPSDLVGKALFYCYYSIYHKRDDRDGKSVVEFVSEKSGEQKSELILNFLKEYHTFKKHGLKDKE
jgi:hypothetical protein